MGPNSGGNGGAGMLPPFGAASPQFNNNPAYGVAAPTHAIPASYPDTNFPLAHMPPLTNASIITPVPVQSGLDSQTSVNLPANLPNFSQNDLNMSMDPIENFHLNSSEVRRILQNNDFSIGLSSEQNQPRDVDEKGLSDSLSRLLNNWDKKNVLCCLH